MTPGMIRSLRALCAATLTVWLLGGCASIDVEQYRAEKPVLDLRSYFSGTLDGWGMFQDRSGKVIKRFHVVIDARWDGAQGTLDERVMLNRSPMSKYGFRLGAVTLSFARRTP